MADFVDQEKTCRDCNSKFLFTAGEAAFFAEKQYTPPNRCKPCRDKRKNGTQQSFNQARPQARPEPSFEYVTRPRMVVDAPAPSRQDREDRERRRQKNRREWDNDDQW